MIITGIGELSRGELAGERMNVAYSERSQEDEHSCFSDNTTADLVANAPGIEMVLTGAVPGCRRGQGVLDAVRRRPTPTLADQLRTEVAAASRAVEAIPAPFDQHLSDGVPDDDPGRASILTAIEALEAQTTDDRRRRRGARAHDQRVLSAAIPGDARSRRALVASALLRRGQRRSSAVTSPPVLEPELGRRHDA